MVFREGEAPPESDRSILVVGIRGECVGLDRLTGQPAWRNDLAGGGQGELFIAFRFGVLVVSSSRNRVYRLDYKTGTTLWEAQTSGTGRATILVEPDMIYVAKQGYVDAFDHVGVERWRQGLEGLGFGRISLALPGNVAQADEAGHQ